MTLWMGEYKTRLECKGFYLIIPLYFLVIPWRKSQNFSFFSSSQCLLCWYQYGRYFERLTFWNSFQISGQKIKRKERSNKKENINHNFHCISMDASTAHSFWIILTPEPKVGWLTQLKCFIVVCVDHSNNV